MSSAGTASTHKSLSQGQETTSGPAMRYEDISALSLTTNTGETISPTAGCLFRGIVASVAGQVSIIDIFDNETKVYLNTGVNPTGGKSIIRRAGNAATVLAFILDG